MTPKQNPKIMAQLKAMTPEQIREYKQLEAKYKHLLAVDEANIKREDVERQRNLALWADMLIKIDALDEAPCCKDPKLYAAFLEVRELFAEIRSLPPLFEVRRHQGKTGGTKLGRPSIWRGYAGLSFVFAVNEIRKQESCSIAQAIRYVKKHIPGWGELLQGVSDAALQVRYQEARKYWALFLNTTEFDAVLTQHIANHHRLRAAMNRVSRTQWRFERPLLLDAVSRVERRGQGTNH
jgi:hypothetical protein